MEGIYFDISVVRRAQAFASTLFLTQCTQSGDQEPLKLLPNSMKLVANLLGWKKADGTRLYRKCYYSVARKNTKTQTAAFLGLNQMFLDPEPEQRIYVAAKEREQAGICFDAALSMLRTNPELEEMCHITQSTKTIVRRDTGSRFKALSAEGKSKHGLNPSMVVFDELHAWGHAEQELYDALTTGSSARREPLYVFITTAGDDEQTLCYREYEYAKRVLTNQHQDPTYLPLIWEVPKDADWTDESVWHLANPTLDVVVRREELRADLHQALAMPSAQNAFKKLHCNIWVNAAEQWIPLTAWDACRQDFVV